MSLSWQITTELHTCDEQSPHPRHGPVPLLSVVLRILVGDPWPGLAELDW
jgi:hypothetical protein